MELLPMRLHFDSPQSFSLWLAAALPSCRHEVRGGAVRVASSDLSAVLIKPGAPGYVAIEYEKPSGSVASLVALVQFAALVGGLWLLMKDGHYPGLIVRENGIDSFSKTGAVWWACALAFVVFMAWLPGAVVHFLGRSGASPIRGALAALLQGHPPPAPVGKGTGAGLALAVALVAVVSVGLTVGALFSSTGSPSATQDNPTVSSPRPAEETWRTESGPGWTLSVPSGWARREVNGSVTLESTDPLNPTVTRLLSAAVPHFATMADVRLLLARRVARMGRTVTEREVSANGMTWFEVEWLNVDTTPVRGFRRGGLAGGRVWEIDCAGDDVLFERVRPTCERFFASLRITAPPPAPPSPATTTRISLRRERASARAASSHSAAIGVGMNRSAGPETHGAGSMSRHAPARPVVAGSTMVSTAIRTRSRGAAESGRWAAMTAGLPRPLRAADSLVDSAIAAASGDRPSVRPATPSTTTGVLTRPAPTPTRARSRPVKNSRTTTPSPIRAIASAPSVPAIASG